MKTLLLLLAVSFASLAQSTQPVVITPVKLGVNITIGPITARCDRGDLSGFGPIFAIQPFRFNVSLVTTNPDTTKMRVTVVTQAADGTLNTSVMDANVSSGQNAVAFFPTSDPVLLSFSVVEESTPRVFNGSAGQ